MKKIIALLLALVLCFSLCACGGKVDTAAVTSELNGSSWASIFDQNNYTVWTFDYGIVASLSIVGGFEATEQGTFEVHDDVISLIWDDPDCGRSKELYYTFENNELKVYTDKDKQKELECIKKEEGHDKIEETTTAKIQLPDNNIKIDYDLAETVAKQEIVNLCCDNSHVSSINIDYGKFTYAETNSGYKFEAQGTYLPKDDYGMYGDRVKFNIRLIVDNNQKISVQLKDFTPAY